MRHLIRTSSTAFARKPVTLLRHRHQFGWIQAAPCSAPPHHHPTQHHQQSAATPHLTLPPPAATTATRCTRRIPSPTPAGLGSSSRAALVRVYSASSNSCSPCSSGVGASFSSGCRKSGSTRSSSHGAGGGAGGHGPIMRSSRPSIAARAGGGGQQPGSEQTGDGFWTLQGYVLYESEVKKSKFVVHAWPASTPGEALALIRAASDPAASHNCYAYRVGLDTRCSDDGEPGGTAGRPIAGAIEGEGLDRVAVLVTRYFGGIKLGAGGLVRAYAGAAKECLRLAPRVFARAQKEVTVEVTYDELGIVYGSLDMYGCTRLAEEYGSSGTVEIRALVDADRFESLRAAVADGTGGRRRVEVANDAATAAAGS